MRLRNVGLPWSRAVVAALEAGNKNIYLSEFVLLCYALDRAPGTWFADDTWAQLQPESRMHASDLQRFFSGDSDWFPVSRPLHNSELFFDLPTLPDWWKVSGEAEPAVMRYKRIDPELNMERLDRAKSAAKGDAERKAAGKLGLTDPVELSVAALALWGHSLTAERDKRVALMRLPHHGTRSAVITARRQTTQQLMEELEPVVRRADG
jgi:hypothetical protein